MPYPGIRPYRTYTTYTAYETYQVAGTPLTSHLSLFTSALPRFAGADVVTFNVHNLDQIPKGIQSEETRPKWQRSCLSDFITGLGERRPVAVQTVHFDTKMMGRIPR